MSTWNSFEEYNFWNSDYNPGGGGGTQQMSVYTGRLRPEV